MTDKLEIKFYKLQNGEDIVAFQLQEHKGHYKIRRPLSVEVDNNYETGKQMLDVREWVPPIVCSSDVVYLPKNLVVFVTDVKESFKDEFVEAVDYLYKVEPKKKAITEKVGNVLPFMPTPTTKLQ